MAENEKSGPTRKGVSRAGQKPGKNAFAEQASVFEQNDLAAPRKAVPKGAARGSSETLAEQAAAADESSIADMAGTEPIFQQTGRVSPAGKPTIHVAKGLSPRGNDILLYSVDAAFSVGTLQGYVLSELGILENERNVLARSSDYMLYQTQKPPHALLAAVVSLGPTTPSIMLRNSLTNMLVELGPHVRQAQAKRLWVPLLGTGAAGLSHIQSAEVINEMIVNPRTPLPPEITDIYVSLPPTITDEQARQCLEIFGLSGEKAPEPPAPPSEMPDQFHPDRPITKAEGDDLGRDAIAAAIVTNVTNVWADHKRHGYPFAIHLSGRWGSGKSSVLSFLKERLVHETTHCDPPPEKVDKDNPQGWVVAEYNAWKMQDAGPAWWTLLNTVAEQTYKDLGLRGRYLRLKDTIWRITRIARPWMVVVAALLGLLSLYLVLGTGDDVTQTETVETITTITQGDTVTKTTDKQVDPIRSPNTFLGAGNAWAFIVAAISALGSIGALLKFLAGFTKTSNETAEAVRNLQSDPTAALKDRYEKVIRQTKRPVAVFIDDLDRCEAQFVVDLLQSLQTAYADVPVLYVVASDRDWIVSAHNQVYKDFKPEISKPGAPLGFLFVKKIFQLSVPIPDIAGGLTTTLTKALLKRQDDTKPVTTSRAERIASINQAAAIGDTAKIAEIQAQALAEGQNIMTELVEAVAQPAAQAAAAHELLAYTDLFDSTPRGIKRLINALTFRQGYILTAAQDIPFDTITRWTILSLRFPYTADFLARHPEKVAKSERTQHDDAHFPNSAQIDQILEGLIKDDIEKVAAFG